MTGFALSVGGRKRNPRNRDRDYLAWVHQLPCLTTGRHCPVEAAHIRYSDLRYGKRQTGMGTKPDDRWVVPLSPEEHRDQHAHGERAWWEAKRIDPVLVAALLYSHFLADDLEAAEAVCVSARQGLIPGAP